MKTLLTIALFLTSVSTFAGSLKCYSGPDQANYGAIIVDVVEASCHAKDGTKYSVSISGIGPALRLAVQSEFGITCIGKKNFEGKYFGAKANAGWVFSAEAGVFVGKGFCALGAVEPGFGASLVGAELEIVRE